jgi:hypothetical protein
MTSVVAVGGAALGGRAHRKPAEARLGEHLGDAGAVERGGRAGQRLGDFRGGVAGPAQLDDPLPGGVLGRCPGRAGPWGGEEAGLAGPEVAYR